MGKRERYIILSLILTGILMFVVDGSVVGIALPTITGYFDTDVAHSQWVVTSYLMTMTCLLLFFGRISEYTGRARLFMAGFAVFTLSSLACGLSTSLETLVIFRIFQAVGASMAFSISTAIIFEISPKGEQGRAMGYIGASVAIGSIAGPTFGGIIIDTLGWHYIFLINVPIGIALLGLASRYMRLQETRRRRLDMDWMGALAMISLVVSLMMLLGEYASALSFNADAQFYALIFLASLTLLVVDELRNETPLLDVSIFEEKSFILPNLTMMLFFISNFAVVVLGPFYFEGVIGLSPTQVGVVYLIVPAVMFVGSPVGGWLYDKHYFKYYAAMGMAITALSLLLLGYTSRRADMPLILLSFATLGVGSALFQSPINAEIMSSLPPRKLGMASSFSTTVRNLGMTLGVTLSTVMISVQLKEAGYYGSIVDASPELLALTVSKVMTMAGMLCLIGIATSVWRNKNFK